jgi:hypothetical protein
VVRCYVVRHSLAVSAIDVEDADHAVVAATDKLATRRAVVHIHHCGEN